MSRFLCWLKTPPVRLVSCTCRHSINLSRSIADAKSAWKKFYTPDEDSLILRRLAEGADHSSIARELGRSWQAIRARSALLKPELRAVHRQFTEAEDAFIMQRRREKVAWCNIARDLNCAQDTIRRRWLDVLRHKADFTDSNGAPYKHFSGLNVEQTAALILQRKREGSSFKSIADELGCSLDTARYRYYSACAPHESLAKPKRPFSDTEKHAIQRHQLEGLSIGAIATKLGRTITSLQWFLGRELRESLRPLRPFTDDDDRKLLDLRAQGSSYKAIAKVLDRAPKSVYGRYSLLTQPHSRLPRRAFTTAEIDTMLKLYRQNVSISEIASIVHRKWAPVRNRIQSELLRRGEPERPAKARHTTRSPQAMAQLGHTHDVQAGHMITTDTHVSPTPSAPS